MEWPAVKYVASGKCDALALSNFSHRKQLKLLNWDFVRRF